MPFLVYLKQENRSVRCALHFRHDIPEPKKFLVIVFSSGLHFVDHLKSFAFFPIKPVSFLYEKPNLYFKIMNCDDDIGYFVVDHSEN